MVDYKDLLAKAIKVSEKAYAPYSDFRVGACVLASSGKTYCGCNFENASYGLSICAERNAIGQAIANGEKEIKAVAIYSPKMKNCLPCGACRQVIFEFAKNDVDIITQDDNEDGYKVYKINNLLPEGFRL